MEASAAPLLPSLARGLVWESVKFLLTLIYNILLKKLKNKQTTISTPTPSQKQSCGKGGLALLQNSG